MEKTIPRIRCSSASKPSDSPFSSSPPTLRKFRGAHDVGVNVPNQLAIMTFNESHGLLKAQDSALTDLSTSLLNLAVVN